MTVTTSCIPSGRRRPTTSVRLSFAGASNVCQSLIGGAARSARRTPKARGPRRGRSADGRAPQASRSPAPGSQTPLSASEFASVFRRCAKPPETMRASSAGRGGPGTRSKATSAESTFGGGRNTVRAIAWNPVRRALSRISTETAPYAFVPGSAKKRSATSRCTITHQLTTVGIVVRLSTTSGVAMLYGRFETSLPGAGSSAARSSASASPKTSSTFVRSARASRSGPSRLRSSSTAWTCATRSARKVVSTPRPGPISRTTSSGRSPARRSITPSTFRSTRKCWPSAFLGATRITRRRGRTPRSRSRRSVPRAPRDRRLGPRRARPA